MKTMSATNSETKPAATRRGAMIPPDDVRLLRSLTRAIRAGQLAAEVRADELIRLRGERYSLDVIAAAAGVTREAVRKSIGRRSVEGYDRERT